MEFEYNWESLNRHGITPKMIDEVLQGSMISTFPIEDAFDICEMIVGYTLSERLIEVGVRYRTDNSIFIFHAQVVSPRYRKLFEEDWIHG